MCDVKCPYCGKEQEINHDDGYGYEEFETHEQECVQCEKYFKYETHVHMTYSVYCENENEHNMVNYNHNPNWWECTKCDYYEIRNTENS